MRLFILLLLLVSFFSNGQDLQLHIAKLKKELKTNPNEERKTVIYSDLCWDYIDISLDSAVVYAEKALRMSNKTKKPELISQSYSNLGAVYLRKENFEKAEAYYLHASKIRKANKDNEGVAKININLGNVYASKQDYLKATEAFLKAINYFEKQKNDTIVSMTKGNLGLIFYEMKDYTKAIKYLEESTSFLKKAKLDQGLCRTYLSLGDVYITKKDTAKGLAYFNTSLLHCDKCKDNLGVATVSQRLGDIYTELGQTQKAKAHFKVAEKLLKELNSEIENANMLLSQSQDFINAKKYDEAYVTLLRIKKIHQKNKSKRYMLETYKQLTLVCLFKNMKDSSAHYFEKYNELREEILQASVLDRTAELDTKYQTAKKEQLLLQKEAEANSKTNTIIILTLLSLFIAIVGYLIYRQQKLKNIQQKHEFDMQNAIAQIQTQNKLHEQRLDISRDLHDNIGAQLTFIISSIENLKFGFPSMDASIKEKLSKISDFTKITIVELRDTIWAMNTNEFTFDDLSSRIYNFIENAQTASDNVKFVFSVDDQVKKMKFTSLEGVNIYRSIQEAVNNAMKYSGATEIKVEVFPGKKGVKIQISDNGIGFDVENATLGNGIYNMKKRIEDISGLFYIHSSSENGTQVILSLPKHTIE
jgi:signal transduction histidine kinase